MIVIDVLLTGGSLSLKELQSKTVRTGPADTTQRSEGSGPALVRILLRHSGKVQRFLYPSDQCDWWFVSASIEPTFTAETDRVF